MILDLNKQEINSIIDVLRAQKGTDLHDYAHASLSRRVHRFFELKKISGVKDFEKRIRNDETFADSFIDEVTVNVTEMFRDPGFWSEIRDSVLPELAERRLINIWHAACSTGEEVYSMAILLKESGLLQKSRIVATDLNERALKKSYEGFYTKRKQEINEKNYESFGGRRKLSDYYKVSGNHVIYDQELIRSVEFKKHDLAKDGCFGIFDLIICRNVLIYFNFNLKEKVIGLFSQSLDEKSYLGIGSKESLEWTRSGKCFKTINIDEKIYQKN